MEELVKCVGWQNHAVSLDHTPNPQALMAQSAWAVCLTHWNKIWILQVCACIQKPAPACPFKDGESTCGKPLSFPIVRPGFLRCAKFGVCYARITDHEPTSACPHIYTFISNKFPPLYNPAPHRMEEPLWDYRCEVGSRGGAIVRLNILVPFIEGLR